MPDGSKHFGKAINANPEKFYTSDIMERIEVAAGLEYKYGDSDLEEPEVVSELEEPNVD